MKRKQIRFIGYCLATGLITALTLVMAACSSPSTSKPAPDLISIAVTPAVANLAVGAAQQFVAIGTYSDGSTQNITSQVTWTSSDLTVATILSSFSGGLATSAAAGNTNITATLSGVTSPVVKLTVVPP